MTPSPPPAPELAGLTEPERRALSSRMTTEGCLNCRAALPRGVALPIECVRPVLAECQRQGGDPAKVYPVFLRSHTPACGAVPSLEDALPKA